MPIKYKTKLTKVKITDLKKRLYDLLAECDMAGSDGEGKKFYIYHGIKVSKYANEYSVKTYEELTSGKERLIEITNLYMLHLLVESVPNEIEVISS